MRWSALLLVVLLSIAVPLSEARCPEKPRDCYAKILQADKGASVDALELDQLQITTAVYDEDDIEQMGFMTAFSAEASGHEGVQIGVGERGGLVVRVVGDPEATGNVTIVYRADSSATPELSWDRSDANFSYDMASGEHFELFPFRVDSRPDGGRVDIPYGVEVVDGGASETGSGEVSFEVPESCFLCSVSMSVLLIMLFLMLFPFYGWFDKKKVRPRVVAALEGVARSDD